MRTRMIIPIIAFVTLLLRMVYSNNQTIRIGGVFPMTTLTDAVDTVGIQRLAAFIMAVEDLNERYAPRGIKVKISVRDSKRSFTNAVRAALATKSVFSGAGVHGVIGAGTNSVSEAMAFILQDSDIAQIAYASDASDLSHQNVYTHFLRVYHSSSFQGYALADIVFKRFDYTRVVVVYSTDSYGTDALGEFKGRASANGHQILAKAAVSIGASSDFSDAISSLEKYDPRIFVFLISDVATACKFLKEGYQRGMITSNSLILGTSALTSSSIWKSMGSPKAAEVVAQIYMGLSYADSDWMVTAQGKKFLQRIRSQPSTAGYTDPTTGITTCNNATDDDGGFYLYQALNVQGTEYECTGQVFSDYAANGVNMSHYSAHIYDATVAMVQGIVAYADTYNGGLIPSKVSGKVLKDLLIKNVSFDGYSGTVSFSTGSKYVANYGVGDRTIGIRFALNQVHMGNGSMSQYRFERFGTWRSEGGYTLCEDELNDYGYFEALTGACASFNHLLPPETAHFVVQLMPSSIKSALYFMASLQLFFVVLIALGIAKYRSSRLMRASQPTMMGLVLSLGIWGAARTILASYPIDPQVCMLDYWTGHLSMIGIVALFVKSLRVYLLVARGGGRVKMSTRNVLMLTGGIVFFFVSYMGIVSAVDRQLVAVRTSTAITGQETHMLYCTSTVPVLEYVLYGLECILLLVSARVCHATENLPDAVSEAKSIALSIFLILAVSVGGFAVVMFVGLFPYMNELIIGACFCISVSFTLVAFFGPKFFILLRGGDLNKKFQVEYKHRKEKGNDDPHSTTVKDPVAYTVSASGSVDISATADKVAAAVSKADAEAERVKYKKYIMAVPKDPQILEGLIDYITAEMIKKRFQAELDLGSQSQSQSQSRSGAASRMSIDHNRSSVGSVVVMDPMRSSVMAAGGGLDRSSVSVAHHAAVPYDRSSVSAALAGRSAQIAGAAAAAKQAASAIQLATIQSTSERFVPTRSIKEALARNEGALAPSALGNSTRTTREGVPSRQVWSENESLPDIGALIVDVMPTGDTFGATGDDDSYKRRPSRGGVDEPNLSLAIAGDISRSTHSTAGLGNSHSVHANPSSRHGSEAKNVAGVVGGSSDTGSGSGTGTELSRTISQKISGGRRRSEATVDPVEAPPGGRLLDDEMCFEGGAANEPPLEQIALVDDRHAGEQLHDGDEDTPLLHS